MTAKSHAVTAAFLFGLAAPAFAQNQNHPAAGGIRADEAAAAHSESAWTIDRLANAKPMPLPRVDPAAVPKSGNAPVTNGPQGFLPAGRPKVPPATDIEQTERFNMLNHEDGSGPEAETTGFTYEMPFTNYRPPVLNAYPYSTVGKLFFYVPPGASISSGDYVCSASVAANTHTILTARHCVFDYSTGTWYQNWVFYPAYNDGPNAVYHNGYNWRYVYTWTSGASGYDYDIAFIQLFDAGGSGCGGSTGSHSVGHYTGWLGSTWNGDFSQRQWDVFGYPQASPFDGNYQYQDEAATGTLNPFGTTNVVEIGNPQTDGTSGGPWVIGLDPLAATDPSPTNNTVSGGNFANSVNSFKWTNPSQPLAINGPAFMTYNFLNLYNGYNAHPCP